MLVQSGNMGVYEVIMATLDSCIEEAKAMFFREQSTLIRYPEQTEAEYSHGERVKDDCLACKKEKVEYLIIGQYAEKKENGNVTWTCYAKGKITIKGPKIIVSARLKAMNGAT